MESDPVDQRYPNPNLYHTTCYRGASICQHSTTSSTILAQYIETRRFDSDK